MRKGGRFGWVFAFAFATLSACVSNYTTSPDGDARGDAGSSTLPDSSSDAAVEMPDASPPADASDASTPGDAGYDDFERVGAPANGPLDFTLELGPQGSEQIGVCSGTGASTSCEGQTIRLAVLAGPAGSGPFLGTSLPPTLHSLRLGFSMMLTTDGTVPISQALLASIELTSNRYIYFETRNGAFELGSQYATESGAFVSESELGSTTDMNVWARYDLVVDFDAGAVRVLRNGQPYGDSLQLQDQLRADPSLIRARIGITYTDGVSNVQEYVDDVGLTEMP